MRLIATMFLALASTAAANDHQFKLEDVYTPGKDGFAWTMFVDESPQELARIRCVEYTLYPTYPNPSRSVCERGTRFAVSDKAWGEFNVVVRFVLNDGQTTVQSYTLDLHSRSRNRPWAAAQSSPAREATAPPQPAITDPGQLFRRSRIVGLAFLPSGMVILDGYRKRLLQARPNGLVEIDTGPLHNPIDIAGAEIDGHEFILLISRPDAGNLQLTAYTTDGTKANGWQPLENGNFDAVAADRGHHSTYLAIQTPFAFDIFKLDDQSLLKHDVHSFLPITELSIRAQGIGRPYVLMAVDSASQRLFVATDTGDLVRIDLRPPHSHPTPLQLHKNLDGPRALAWNSGSHTLYVAAGRHLWAVKVDINPPDISEFVPTHHFNRITALALDSNQVLWVGDSDAHALYLVSAAGQIIQSLQ